MDIIPNKFICPITLKIMKEHVLYKDGYTFERDAISHQSIDKTKLIHDDNVQNNLLKRKAKLEINNKQRTKKICNTSNEIRLRQIEQNQIRVGMGLKEIIY